MDQEKKKIITTNKSLKQFVTNKTRLEPKKQK